MIRIAHLSDIHISQPWETLSRLLWSKRLLGGLDVFLLRRWIYRNRHLPYLVEDILRRQVDRVVVTGDLTSTSLQGEFALVRQMLAPLSEAKLLTTIPGNHDVYTRRAEREQRYEQYFRFAHGESSESDYPFAQPVGQEVVLIGLNTCLATGWGAAWGRIDDLQLAKLPSLLTRYEDRFRVLLLHHHLRNPKGVPGPAIRALRNGAALAQILLAYGAELILHGHHHERYSYHLSDEHRSIPVLIPGPATRRSSLPRDQGGYQIYDIEKGQIQSIWSYRFDHHLKLLVEEKQTP